MSDATYPIFDDSLTAPSDPVWITFILSVLVHALAFLCMIVMPGIVEKEPYTISPESVISVSMVAMDALQPGAIGTESGKSPEPSVQPEADDQPVLTPDDLALMADSPEPETAPEAADTPAPTEEDLIAQSDTPIEPEPEVKAQEPSAPEKTMPEPLPEAAEAVAPAKAKTPVVEKPNPDVKVLKPKLNSQKPKSIAKSVVKPEDIKPESIKSAIAKIRKKQAGQAARIARSSGSGGSSRQRAGQIGGVFLSQVRALVERNWTASSQLMEMRDDLQSSISVTVNQDGHVLDIFLKQNSGNRYLDDSALRAVRKVGRFPPLPPGVSGNQTFVLRFSPKGVN